jgi:MinD-like ATPase involved in chromosome partitioning or flagellar assembly
MSEKMTLQNNSNQVSTTPFKSETISVVSGKGGTGKTLVVASLAYALQKAGQKVCLIDTDFATQGLSLFILGPGAERGTARLAEENSLYHMIQKWEESSHQLPRPKGADRFGEKDHDMSYQLIVSNKQFYDRRLALGSEQEAQVARAILNESMGETNDAFRKNYRPLMRTLVQSLSNSGQFDYILIDTRGGFGEASLVPVVFSDSFIVVAEPDFTSFHQLAKLLTNIDLMAQQENTAPYIRGVIVNKAVDGEEEKFRALLQAQFDIEFNQSWPIPLDADAVRAYKQQLIPYRAVAGSVFSFRTLKAFSEIFDIVTVEWEEASKRKWHELYGAVEGAYAEQQARSRAREEALQLREKEFEERLKRQDLELERNKLLVSNLEARLNEEKDRRKKAEELIFTHKPIASSSAEKPSQTRALPSEKKFFRWQAWVPFLAGLIAILLIFLFLRGQFTQSNKVAPVPKEQSDQDSSEYNPKSGMNDPRFVDVEIRYGSTDPNLLMKYSLITGHILSYLNGRSATELDSVKELKDSVSPQGETALKALLKGYRIYIDAERLSPVISYSNGDFMEVRPINVRLVPESQPQTNSAGISLNLIMGFTSSELPKLDYVVWDVLAEQVELTKSQVSLSERSSEYAQVQNFLASLEAAYNERDLNFLRRVYVDSAEILLGLRRPQENNYYTRSKDSYLRNLANIFAGTKMIFVKLDSVRVKRDPRRERGYIVEYYQRWETESYSDRGWIYAYIEFNEKSKTPIIKRQWQPFERSSQSTPSKME